MVFQKYVRFLPVLVLILAELIFLLLQIFDLSFRLGDGNVYWYMADVIRHGTLPYRDFFLADPPLYVLFLVPFEALFRSHLVYLQFVPAILEMISAAGLFFFLQKKRVSFYWLAPVIYLFSFTILATSDYGTGLQLATCFVVTALLCWEYKKYWLVGMCLAAACLTKAYMAPIVIGILSYLAWHKKYCELQKIVIGGLVTTVLILLPFIFISGKLFFADVVFHQFSRPEGISKISVLGFFFTREWFILFLTTAGMYLKRRSELVWPFAAMAIFFLFFRDIYYAYLGSLLPFITIFSILFLEYIWNKNDTLKRVGQMLVFLLCAFLIFSTAFYWQVIRIEGKFSASAEMAEKLSALPDTYPLYGIHETTPLLALLTHRKIFSNYIDTNTQTFASTVNNREEMSERAAKNGVYLFTREITNQKGERISLHRGYFSDEIFSKACKKVAESEGRDVGGTSEAIFFCKL